MKSYLQGHAGFMIRCILNNFIFSNAIYKKGKTFTKKMHDLGITQNVQQYPKLLRLEELFMSFFYFKWIVSHKVFW